MVGATIRVFINKEDEQPKTAFEGGINDEDFKEGSIGLSTFRTRTAFDSVMIKPIGDMPTEVEEKDDKVSQEIEDIKIKEAGGSKKSQLFENDNDKKMSWKQCLIYRTLKERNQHCESKYGFAEEAL